MLTRALSQYSNSAILFVSGGGAMSKMIEWWHSSTIAERLAIAILAVGLSIEAVLLFIGIPDGAAELSIFTAAFMVSLIAAVFMLPVGGGNYTGFWRRALDKCLPLFAWSAVLAMLIVTSSYID